MRLTRAELKEHARGQLAGRFGMLFLCFLVVFIINMIFSKSVGLKFFPKYFDVMGEIMDSSGADIDSGMELFENELMGITAYVNLSNALKLAYAFLVAPMLTVGLCQVLLNVTYGDSPKLGTLFEPFITRFGKSIGTFWLKKLFELLWMIPVYVITIICVAVICGTVFASDSEFFKNLIDGLKIGNDTGSALLLIFAIILAFLAIVLTIGLIVMVPYSIIISKYAMTIYIMNEQPNLTPTQCIGESKRIMNGNRLDYFIFKLSFLPWFILGCITGGLALIYVIPYYKLAITNYYHNIKGSLPNTAE